MLAQQGIAFQGLPPWSVTCKSPQAREGEHFDRVEKEVARAVVNRVHGFSLAESLSRKESFFLLLGSAIVAKYESSPSGVLTLLN